MRQRDRASSRGATAARTGEPASRGGATATAVPTAVTPPQCQSPRGAPPPTYAAAKGGSSTPQPPLPKRDQSYAGCPVLPGPAPRSRSAANLPVPPVVQFQQAVEARHQRSEEAVDCDGQRRHTIQPTESMEYLDVVCDKSNELLREVTVAVNRAEEQGHTAPVQELLRSASVGSGPDNYSRESSCTVLLGPRSEIPWVPISSWPPTGPASAPSSAQPAPVACGCVATVVPSAAVAKTGEDDPTVAELRAENARLRAEMRDMKAAAELRERDKGQRHADSAKGEPQGHRTSFGGA